MNCKPMEHREVIRDEQGVEYASLASYDVDGQSWHIVGGAKEFTLLIPNMIDAGIYRPHNRHADPAVPTQVAASLHGYIASIVPPHVAGAKALQALRKELEPKPPKENKGTGGKGKPADTQAGGQSDDDKGPSTDTLKGGSNNDSATDTGDDGKKTDPDTKAPGKA